MEVCTKTMEKRIGKFNLLYLNTVRLVPNDSSSKEAPDIQYLKGYCLSISEIESYSIRTYTARKIYETFYKLSSNKFF